MSGSTRARCRWRSGIIPLKTRNLQAALPGRFYLRSGRPDPRLVLLAARHQHLLFDEECYKNVICLGLILDAKGRRCRKSRGNMVNPWDVINKHGADAMRWYLYTASPPGQERRFSADLVGEVVRNFTLTLWNTYSFFVTYANLDGWKPEPNGSR
jgi:isoleucyl-tRNA synthetase